MGNSSGAASRIGAEKTITTYMEAADGFGLTVSIPKTKLTVSGYGIEEEDRKPIVVRGEEIECVELTLPWFSGHVQWETTL